MKPRSKPPRWPDQGQRDKSRQGQEGPPPRLPDKATNAPPGASEPHGKSKVKGRRNCPDAKAHRKTKAGSQSSKPTVTKGKNGDASLAKKKMKNKVPKETAGQGTGEGLKAKATAPPKGSGSKTAPASLARKTEVPKGPRIHQDLFTQRGQ